MLISTECILRKCDVSDYQIEILEGEGMILVSETKDQIVFFNETAMMLWNMIDQITHKDLFERYMEVLKEEYEITSESDVHRSFEEILSTMLDNSLIEIDSDNRL